MKLNDRKFWLPALLFLIVFIVHFDSDVVTPSDSRWTIPVALNIIKNHTTHLDEFRYRMVTNQWYAIDSVNGHYYSKYSIGTTLITVPFIFVIDKICKRVLNIDIYKISETNSINGLELLIASFIVALSAIFIFLISQLILKNDWQSVLITLIFGFCTSAWSTASRALWQHGPSMLLFGITLYLLLKAKEKPKLVIWTALPLAFSFVNRPTDAIPIFFLTLFILINYRQYFMRYLLLASVIAIPLFIYNYSIYGTLLTPYYMGYKQGHNDNYLEAILGNLFSPSRGLFIFSPVLSYALLGMRFRSKNFSLKELDPYVALIIVVNLLLFSRMKIWWAGWCFGPRYFTDILPFLIYFLIRAFEWINSKSAKQKLIFGTVLMPLIIISFYINYRGATHFSTWEWNYLPNYISDHPERNWQWNDLQFLR